MSDDTSPARPAPPRSKGAQTPPGPRAPAHDHPEDGWEEAFERLTDIRQIVGKMDELIRLRGNRSRAYQDPAYGHLMPHLLKAREELAAMPPGRIRDYLLARARWQLRESEIKV